MNAIWSHSGIEWWQLTGWTMLHFLWIGAIIGLAAVFVRLLLRSAPPGVRYAAMLVALSLLFAAPVAIGVYFLSAGAFDKPNVVVIDRATTIDELPDVSQLNISETAPLAPGSAGGHIDADVDAAVHGTFVDALVEVDAVPRQSRGLTAREYLDAVADVVPWLWLIGSPLTFLLLATGLVGAERLRRASRALDDGPIVDACARIAATLRIGRCVAVAVCDRIAAPVLVGIVRPIILLPPSALTGWTPDEIEMVLLHELAHVRRWDNLVNLLQRIVEALLFFHPAVWLVSAWVRREREACCDAVVVARTDSPHAYAELLVALAAQMPRSVLFHPTATSAMAAGPLRTRIRRILKLEDDSMLVSGKSLALVIGGLLVAASVSLLYLPNRGEAQESDTDATAVSEETTTDENTADADAQWNDDFTTDGAPASASWATSVAAPQSNSPFPTLEEQKQADRAWKMLGLELEPIGEEDLARVKELGYQGGLLVTDSTQAMRQNDAWSRSRNEYAGIARGDILIGLHVWPTMNLSDVGTVLGRDDLAELSPLKFYVIRQQSVEIDPRAAMREQFREQFQRGGGGRGDYGGRGWYGRGMEGYGGEFGGEMGMGEMGADDMPPELRDTVVTGRIEVQLPRSATPSASPARRATPESHPTPASSSAQPSPARNAAPATPQPARDPASAAPPQAPVLWNAAPPSADPLLSFKQTQPAPAADPFASGVTRPAPTASPEEVAVLKEHVKLLEAQHERINALHKSASPGGSQKDLEQIACELAISRGELALAEDNERKALAEFEKALEHSQKAHEAITAAYEVGRADHGDVLDAARKAADVELRVIRLRQDMERTSETPDTASTRTSVGRRSRRARVTESGTVYEEVMADPSAPQPTTDTPWPTPTLHPQPTEATAPQPSLVPPQLTSRYEPGTPAMKEMRVFQLKHLPVGTAHVACNEIFGGEGMRIAVAGNQLVVAGTAEQVSRVSALLEHLDKPGEQPQQDRPASAAQSRQMLELEVQAAKIHLEHAQSEYERIAQLAKTSQASQSELAKAKAAMELAELEVRRAELWLENGQSNRSAVERAPESKEMLELELQAAKINLQHAHSEYERIQKLAESAAVPQAEVEKAKATVEMALLEVRRAELRLKEATEQEQATPEAAAKSKEQLEIDFDYSRAAQAVAEKEYEKLKQYNERHKGAFPPAELDRAKAELERVKIQVKRAKLMLDEFNKQTDRAKEDTATLRYNGRTFDEWRQQWRNELSPDKRAEAVSALAAFGASGMAEEAAREIFEVAQQYDWHSGMGDRDSDPVRFACVAAFGAIYKTGNRIPAKIWLPILLDGIRQNQAHLKDMAVKLLPALGPTDQFAIPSLVELARDAEGDLWYELLTTISRLSPSESHPNVRTVFRELLNGDDPEKIAIAISILGSRSLALADDPLTLLLNPDPAVQRRALWAIRSMGDDAHTEASARKLHAWALEVLNNEEPNDVELLTAIRALGALGERSAGAISRLDRIMMDHGRKLEIRIAAMNSLTLITHSGGHDDRLKQDVVKKEIEPLDPFDAREQLTEFEQAIRREADMVPRQAGRRR